MPLPASILDWPTVARDEYHALRKTCADLRLYVDLSDMDAAIINAAVHRARETDTGTGAAFSQLHKAIKARFLTQTFH